MPRQQQGQYWGGENEAVLGGLLQQLRHGRQPRPSPGVKGEPRLAAAPKHNALQVSPPSAIRRLERGEAIDVPALPQLGLPINLV